MSKTKKMSYEEKINIFSMTLKCKSNGMVTSPILERIISYLDFRLSYRINIFHDIDEFRKSLPGEYNNKIQGVIKISNAFDMNSDRIGFDRMIVAVTEIKNKVIKDSVYQEVNLYIPDSI